MKLTQEIIDICTPHIIEAWRIGTGPDGRSFYGYYALGEDSPRALFLGRMWATGRLDAEQEIAVRVSLLIKRERLSPDWEDFEVVWREAKDLSGF